MTTGQHPADQAPAPSAETAREPAIELTDGTLDEIAGGKPDSIRSDISSKANQTAAGLIGKLNG